MVGNVAKPWDFPLFFKPMFRCLNKTARIRATIAVAVAYAFCVLAPHAAMALTQSPSGAHCLTEPTGMSHMHHAKAPAEHTHADGTKHIHAKSSEPVQTTTHTRGEAGALDDPAKPATATDANCCGLFCVTALAHDGAATLPVPPPRAFEGPAPQAERASRTPDRIYEPPIG